MAAVRLSCLARNGRTGVPQGLARGVESPGKESLTAAVAAEAIEAQPSFGQIKPKRDRVVRAPNSIPEQETWPTSFMEHKKPGIPGDGKEALAYKKSGPPVCEAHQANDSGIPRISGSFRQT